MPLSEHEQRLLDQIERALIAEDPKFASAVRAGRLGKPTRRRRIQGLVVFLIGLVLLVVGVAVHSIWLANVPVVSVVGFLVMLTGALMAITSVGAGGKAPPRVAEPERNRFGGKMEERFRRRFDQE
jgi:VIT1/CCC1 family predicted Fe2+/Mn2+ transporter